jgi:hypothetical protein
VEKIVVFITGLGSVRVRGAGLSCILATASSAFIALFAGLGLSYR